MTLDDTFVVASPRNATRFGVVRIVSVEEGRCCFVDVREHGVGVEIFLRSGAVRLTNMVEMYVEADWERIL